MPLSEQSPSSRHGQCTTPETAVSSYDGFQPGVPTAKHCFANALSLPASSPLWLHPRVIVSPHHADQAQDFPARFAEHFLALAREQRGD